ncbi:LysR family transcriptional regulator [Paenibacillus sp. NPDC056579]|uniref:LysR family transcriptional regulator n=1 Tax=Paenibacillus sp. NPDC056579 TaxID=3345871 RepID=UPI0036CD0ABA
MDIAFYKTLLEVAKWQNYTKAADMLGYAQSSVTSQIQKLEQEYSITIFERMNKKMQPTSDGLELLRYASQIVSLFEESKITISGATNGSFTIGIKSTLASYLLPDYLGVYKQKNPAVQIQIKEVAGMGLLQALKAGECDLGFIITDQTDLPEYVCRTIREEDYAWIAKPDHPLLAKAAVYPEDLNGEEMIMTSDNCTSRSYFETMLRVNHVQYSKTYDNMNFETIKRYVMHGLGISLVPKTIIAPEFENGQLAILPLHYPSLVLKVQLVYHEKKYISKAMRAFIQSVCPER